MRWLCSELFRAALSALVVVLLVASANAQFKASIQGTVTDASGAVIPGATVKVTNNETGRTLQATASGEGFYKISGLPPGRYKVVVEREGFKKKELADLVINAEETQGVDIGLEPGAVTDVVTIS